MPCLTRRPGWRSSRAKPRAPLEGRRVTGLSLADGRELAAEAVILATGTFLGGKLHFGMASRAGGRVGERAATALAAQLRALGLPLARLKTGTPPRLDGRTIDWAGLERQDSDDGGWTMSPMSRGPARAAALLRDHPHQRGDP